MRKQLKKKKIKCRSNNNECARRKISRTNLLLLTGTCLILLVVMISPYSLGKSGSLTLQLLRSSLRSSRVSLINKGGVQVDSRTSQIGRDEPMIAICAATHSKSSWRSLEQTSLNRYLIPSIIRTISPADRSKYTFRLYLAADHDDDFWLRNRDNVETPDWLSVVVDFYEVPKHKIPFNPMMRAAYNDGAEYLVRINDDSEFVTSDWVSKGSSKLASYDPPNVGMVGPDCLEGNTDIMTHDMVHRTHLDIFEYYYPEVFSAWWIDDWISKVYGPQRSTKIMSWRVKHHVQTHEKRYEVQHHEAKKLKGELKKGAAKIEEWLSKTNKPSTKLGLGAYFWELQNIV